MPIQTTRTAQYPVKSAEEILPLVVNEREIVFADIESTGFGQYDDITEIGAVRVDVVSGKVLGKFDTFIHLKTMKKVPPKIAELTRITTEMLTDAPQLETVLPAFQSFIGTSVLSFHNAAFDWRMLQKKYALIGRQLNNEVICTMKLFRYLHPDLSAKLDDVTAYYGTPIEGHHRAFIDCKWTAACYCKMRQELMKRQENGQLVIPSDLPSPSVVITEMTMEELSNECIVHRISGWKKGKITRIYCTTSVADFFYDVNEHVWNVARNKTTRNLNTDILAQFILNKVKMDQTQFVQSYLPGA